MPDVAPSPDREPFRNSYRPAVRSVIEREVGAVTERLEARSASCSRARGEKGRPLGPVTGFMPASHIVLEARFSCSNSDIGGSICRQC